MERIPVRLGERAANDDAGRIEHIDEACDRPADRQERVVDQTLGDTVPCRRSLRDLLGADLSLRMCGPPRGKPRTSATRSSFTPRARQRDARGVCLKVPDATAGAPWPVERNRRVADLDPGVVWPCVESAAADHCATETSTDRDVEEIVDTAPRTEGTLAEDRHLRVVLKERGKVERRADRSSEIRAWKVGSEVRGLNGDPAPRVDRAR